MDGLGVGGAGVTFTAGIGFPWTFAMMDIPLGGEMSPEQQRFQLWVSRLFLLLGVLILLTTLIY